MTRKSFEINEKCFFAYLCRIFIIVRKISIHTNQNLTKHSLVIRVYFTHIGHIILDWFGSDKSRVDICNLKTIFRPNQLQ